MRLQGNLRFKGETVFVQSAQTVTASRQNAFDYDECMSGSIIYTYVGGNPLSRIDPSGNSWQTALIGAFIGGVSGYYGSLATGGNPEDARVAAGIGALIGG